MRSGNITRLIDMGIEPFLMLRRSSLCCAQRLVRKLCARLQTVYSPEAEALAKLGITAEQAKTIKFYKAVGCENCLNTGYKGRLAIFEIMQMTPDIAKLTVDRADSSIVQNQAVKDGMTLLVQDGIRKIALGLTTIEEVLAVATSNEGIVE